MKTLFALPVAFMSRYGQQDGDHIRPSSSGMITEAIILITIVFIVAILVRLICLGFKIFALVRDEKAGKEFLDTELEAMERGGVMTDTGPRVYVTGDNEELIIPGVQRFRRSSNASSHDGRTGSGPQPGNSAPAQDPVGSPSDFHPISHQETRSGSIDSVLSGTSVATVGSVQSTRTVSIPGEVASDDLNTGWLMANRPGTATASAAADRFLHLPTAGRSGTQKRERSMSAGTGSRPDRAHLAAGSPSAFRKFSADSQLACEAALGRLKDRGLVGVTAFDQPHAQLGTNPTGDSDQDGDGLVAADVTSSPVRNVGAGNGSRNGSPFRTRARPQSPIPGAMEPLQPPYMPNPTLLMSHPGEASPRHQPMIAFISVTPPSVRREI